MELRTSPQCYWQRKKKRDVSVSKSKDETTNKGYGKKKVSQKVRFKQRSLLKFLGG
jgi:hypothetical protein